MANAILIVSRSPNNGQNLSMLSTSRMRIRNFRNESSNRTTTRNLLSSNCVIFCNLPYLIANVYNSYLRMNSASLRILIMCAGGHHETKLSFLDDDFLFNVYQLNLYVECARSFLRWLLLLRSSRTCSSRLLLVVRSPPLTMVSLSSSSSMRCVSHYVSHVIPSQVT